MKPGFRIAGRHANSWVRLAICGLLPALILGLSGCGGSSSPPPPLVNALPFLSSLSPSTTSAGGPSFTLTVNGAGFIASSKVRWNASDRATTFVSSTRLTAAIPSTDIASVGTAKVAVFNPPPGGGTSNALNFDVTGAAIASISPASAVATGPGFTLTVNGSGYNSASTVNWNGTPRTTNFVTNTQLIAAILTADISAPGTAQVMVVNPPNITSNAVTFTISPYTPPTITTSSLPDTEAGKFYNFGLAANGGAPPLTWALAAGSPNLPLSLTLDPATGRVTGTVDPSEVGNAINFTVQVTDSSTTSPPPATKILHITVVGAGILGNNNTCPGAGNTAGTTFISNGTIRASISPYGDIDVYSFKASAGAQVTIETFAQRLDIDTNLTFRSDFLDTVTELLDPSCNVIGENDDIFIPTQFNLGTHIQDSLIVVGATPFPQVPSPCDPFTSTVSCADKTPPTSLASGTYYIRIRDFRSDGRPDLIYDLSLSGAN